jgi:HAMP domain-containing protein
MRQLKSIKWQITVIIVLIFTGISILSLYFVYRHMKRTLIDALLNEGRIAALNIAELAAEKLIEDDIIGLKTYIEKYKYNMNIEYILIEDFNNQIRTDTYNGDIPEVLLHTAGTSTLAFDENRINPSIHYIESKGFYDISQPIKEGLLGFVRVGLQKTELDKKNSRTLLYLIVVFTFGTFLAITLALFIITLHFCKPLEKLTIVANRVSMGDFTERVKLKNRNEIGVLGEAIERMRESLKTSLDRLSVK